MSTTPSTETITKEQVAIEKKERKMAVIKGINTFDWKNIPPPVIADLLMLIPYKGSAGDPDYYLEPYQAAIFAIRSYELGLSPFSNEVWYNPKLNKLNVTLEGKMKLARDRGMNFGPPHFTEMKRPWQKNTIKPTKFASLTEEPGIQCTMKIFLANGYPEEATYIAWISEWMMDKSPVWSSKPMHMLQVRALEKCISLSSGAGASEMPDDADIVNTDTQMLGDLGIKG